ncbi:MAG TPA: hypothetical protein VEX41_03720 [Candidatus Eisenbacteria bacterium]|nr:hypothetical protein [Candidatus Eisenbacteria bacterium]
MQPSASPAALITFHSPEDSGFRLPLALTHGPDWEVRVGINALDIVQGNTWGASIFLVNGAKVGDPKDMTKTIPWPGDFFTYLASLPGVKVIQGPEPVTIGGIACSQVIVHVTSFGPFLWLKDDYTWIGSKAQDEKWQLLLLDVNGERVLLWFPDSPTNFDVRYPLVQQIYETISFAK